MAEPPRELYGGRIVRFAGDPTWPVVADWPKTPFQGSVVAVAIAGYEGDHGGFVYWLYEDGTVDDSYRLTLDEAIEARMTATAWPGSTFP